MRVVRAATLPFLDTCLEGDATAMDRLTTEGLRSYLRGVVIDIAVLRK
jgi:hypothetical protein